LSHDFPERLGWTDVPKRTSAPKEDVDVASLTAPLKRCADTKLELSSSAMVRTLSFPAVR